MNNRFSNHRNSRDNQNNYTNGVTFNYSDNFNCIVKLNSSNYNSWRTNMLFLLDINNLSDYVTEPKIQKFKRNKIDGDINKFIIDIDKLDKSVIYNKSTNPTDIKNDTITKWIILNFLHEDTRIFESKGRTAY